MKAYDVRRRNLIIISCLILVLTLLYQTAFASEATDACRLNQKSTITQVVQENFTECRQQRASDTFLEQNQQTIALFDFQREGESAFNEWITLLEQSRRFCDSKIQLEPKMFYEQSVSDLCHLVNTFENFYQKASYDYHDYVDFSVDWPVYEEFMPPLSKQVPLIDQLHYRVFFKDQDAKTTKQGLVNAKNGFDLYLFYCLKQDAKSIIFEKADTTGRWDYDERFIEAIPCFKYTDGRTANLSGDNLQPRPSSVLYRIMSLNLAHIEHALYEYNEPLPEKINRQSHLSERCEAKITASDSFQFCFTDKSPSQYTVEMAKQLICVSDPSLEYRLQTADTVRYGKCTPSNTQIARKSSPSAKKHHHS